MGPAPHVMMHVPESPETRHQIGQTTYDNARHAPDGNLSLSLFWLLFIFLIFQALLNLYRATHLTCEARSIFAAFIEEPPFCAPPRSYSYSTSRKSRPRSNNDNNICYHRITTATTPSTPDRFKRKVPNAPSLQWLAETVLPCAWQAASPAPMPDPWVVQPHRQPCRRVGAARAAKTSVACTLLEASLPE